ncbi:uncharacterized protein [Nicotiana tomentosiformis]|uniref:uncharacterized protein isoform X1 n=1 Tax=Nicotiana tomentosiformis TaxID=4098 RepID=UPI00051C3082|nr:uncharacterized protein LOC104116724 [Nicotiana tomentosiformis]
MLYWKENNLLDSCKVCGASRWKTDKHSGEAKNKNGKKIASKTLHYFSLKPRLQRLFMSTKTSFLMTWHHNERVDDRTMRHPADSMAWKLFDELHPSFAAEPRNVRLGLASDGFQPFRNSKTSYSIWPVVLIPYNLPPWLCMKQQNFIMSMLIPVPDSPGDTIDIYLQPLIEELNELWEIGSETFDASTRQNFKLHTSLLWTINDFPAYGNLSGWSTKGKLACPYCNIDTSSIRLKNSKKQCFMGHRRYLPLNHKWRNDKESFDGTKDKRLPPKMCYGIEILNQVEDLKGFQLTKDPKKRIKISHDVRKDNWNKRSIFFELPYGKSLLLRHNLDVMHIEKNICDNILGMIMNAKGKTKDTIKTRLDWQEMNIRPELHPIKNGEKYEVPTACYTLSPQEKHNICLFLKNLKVPDGFSSNISQCVNLKEHRISGLKSHDCHVLLQHLLPLALRGMLSKTVCEPLIELSLFFNVLGAKVLRTNDLDQIEAQIPITLCKLEKVFSPSFFDVMVHLPTHLANEIKLAGPVQYRWMYPIERWLYFLKSLIGNRACPECSIAEGYLANECMTLCSLYLHRIDTKFNRPERNYDGGLKNSDGGLSLFCKSGKTLGAPKHHDLEADELEQAHIYILKNCYEVLPFLEFDMKPSKNENEMASTVKTTTKYAFVAPGAIGKGRGRGLKSIYSLGVSGPDILSSQSTDQVMQYNQIVETSAVVKGQGRGLRSMCSLGVSGLGPTNKNSLVLEKGDVQTDIPSFSSTDDVMQYIQQNSMSALGKGRGQELRSICSLEEYENEERSFHQNAHYASQSMSRPSKSTMFAAQGLRTMNKNPLVHDKENVKTNILFSPSDDQVMQSTQKVKTSTLGKGRRRELRSMCSFEESENEERSFHHNAHYASQSMSRPSKSTRLDTTMFSAQGVQTKNKNSLVHDKENMQTDIPFSPSIDQVMQSTQTVETR